VNSTLLPIAVEIPTEEIDKDALGVPPIIELSKYRVSPLS